MNKILQIKTNLNKIDLVLCTRRAACLYSPIRTHVNQDYYFTVINVLKFQVFYLLFILDLIIEFNILNLLLIL